MKTLVAGVCLLMAAVAPRPMVFSEGGAWKGMIEKVVRAYRMAGAERNLHVAYYEKFADLIIDVDEQSIEATAQELAKIARED